MSPQRGARRPTGSAQNPSTPDVDALAAPDGAVGAHRAGHRVGVGGAGPQLLGAARSHGRAPAGRVVARGLPVERPGSDPPPQVHLLTMPRPTPFHTDIRRARGQPDPGLGTGLG